MKSVTITLALLVMALFCHAQYFQFSQYTFTNQRINPAIVASSDYAEASVINRNQSTGGGFHLNSNFFNASFPFISRLGMRWSGVGISLMDDRAGQTGLFSTQEVAIAYALNIFTSPGTSFSLGFRALHSRRKVDMNGLHTGLQFVPERGFDESVANGENFGRLSNSFNTFSAGIFWKQEDRKKNTLATAGLSFFDFNKPDEAFLYTPASYTSSLVGTLSYRIYGRKKISIYPEVLATLSSGLLMLNTGFVTSYELQSYRKKPSDRLDIITKYRSHDGPLVGLQFHKENFSVGISYDFPLFNKRSANHGALEIAIALKRLVSPRKNSSKKKNATITKKPSSPRTTPQAKVVKNEPDTTDTKTATAPRATLSDRLKTKQDSVRAMGIPGEITHEPMILEKAVLHFTFNFNSTAIDDEASAYLDEVARALVENPELEIELTGHTDNIGSAKFNLKLSLLRASSIKDYLISQGVSETRIKANGKGLTEPLNGNSTDEERALNRRVEMKILYSRE
jgi:type IX secretion system PorP/SprF family membrane protein